MITRAQITKLASAAGFDAKTVERDYVLTHLGALIARHDTAGSLAWKTELAPYLSEAPHFEEVERRVRRALRRANLIA